MVKRNVVRQSLSQDILLLYLCTFLLNPYLKSNCSIASIVLEVSYIAGSKEHSIISVYIFSEVRKKFQCCFSVS